MSTVHEPDNPEYSILKQRLARRLKANGINETGVKDLTIISLTQVGTRCQTALLIFAVKHPLQCGCTALSFDEAMCDESQASTGTAFLTILLWVSFGECHNS